MNGFVKLSDWLLTWPVRLPFWLWDRSGLGKSIAVIYVVLLLASVFALGFAAVDTFLDRQAGQPAPVIVPPAETETPTTTATADGGAQTATPTTIADGGAQTATPTPSPTETSTALPLETLTPIPTPTATATPSATSTPMFTETPTFTPSPTATTTETPTETPTLIPTETPTLIPTETPTLVPTETATAIPTETPTEAPPQPAQAAVVVAGPLRLGPDPSYPVVDQVEPGEHLQVYARTEDGQWLQVDPVGFTWIAAESVTLDQDLAEIEVARAIPPLPLTTPTETPTPVDVPVRTPPSQGQTTVEETPTPSPSGGLGLPVDAWEYQFGAGTFDEASGRWQYLGGAAAGGLDVDFWEDRVRLIDLRLPPALALPAEEANLFVARLAPEDSELIDAYVPDDRPDTLVQIYRSQWLADQFGESFWPEDNPGLFRVDFTLTDERVTGLIFEIVAGEEG